MPPVFRTRFAAASTLAGFAFTLSFALHAQQLTLNGLRAQGGFGQFNGLKADAAGNLYTLFDAHDGVRLLKIDPAGSQLLAETHIGQQGDQAVALALDPAGNIYVAGTSLSTGSVSGTPGTAFPTRADTTTNSFVARFSPALTEQWLTFLGSGKMAAVAIDASATQIVVTGGIFAPTLPVTGGGIQQAPLPNSASGNGFVEALNPNTGTLQFATYLSGANGGTQPSGIALDGGGNAYIAGTTSATGFPTVNALVPLLLSDSANPVSGFLTKLAPSGDAFVFSTFVPGDGVTSVAWDRATSSLLFSGSIAAGLFPLTNVASPIANRLAYQTAVRMAADGSAVLSASLLVPSTTSAIAPAPTGSAVAATTLNVTGAPLLPAGASQSAGNAFLLQADAGGVVQHTARIGGNPVDNSAYAGIPALLTAIIAAPDGKVIAAGGVAPTLSSSLLPTQRYDFTLVAAPNAALPSTVRDALPPPACNGSACAGGAALLSVLSPGTAPALAFSIDDLPNVVLRNVGASEAIGLQLSASGYTFATTCTGTLPAGSECDVIATGAGPGSLSVRSGNAASATIALPTNLQATNPLSLTPKELDFGLVSSASPPRTRTLTITNLGSTAQTFPSQLSGLTQAYTIRESASDCTPAGNGVSKVLASRATCHITLAVAAAADPAQDGPVGAHWLIGTREIALTGYVQAAALSVSATHVGFGRQYAGGLRVPRYLYLSNGSDLAQTHATISLPPGSPFTLTDGCPGTLAPQSVCAMTLTYNPTVVPSADAVTLDLDGGLTVLVDGQTLPQPGVSGASVNPFLSVSPLNFAFANAVVATTVSSEIQTVSIQNTGRNAFALSVVASGDFLSSTCPSPLAGGASCTLTVQFTPSAAGNREGLLSIKTGSSEPVYVALSGQGTAFLPVNSGAIDFGEVPLQTASVQWFKIGRPFHQLTVASSLPGYGVILVEDQGFGHGQPGRGSFQQRASGSCLNCYVGVQFLPAQVGAQVSVLSFSSAASGMSQTLAATGVGRALTGLLLTPVSRDFGSVSVGSTTAGAVFALTNATATRITASAPTLTGDFSLSPATTGGPVCGGALESGASCLLPVLFAPSVTGARTGTLAVSTSGGSASAKLTGFGSANPDIDFQPGSLIFRNVPGTESVRQTITLTNAGPQAATFGTPSSSDPHFSPSSTCSTLAPAAACTITVFYGPTLSLSSGLLTIPITTASGGAAQTTNYTIPLSGLYTAENAGIQIVPGEEDAVNFGSVATGNLSGIRVLHLNNLTGRSLTLSVESPRQFPVVASTCSALAPFASCDLSLTYAPLTDADITGTVFVQATPDDGSPTLDGLSYLEGYGLASNTIAVSGNLSPTGVLDFGQVSSGEIFAQTIAITNRGDSTGAGSVVTVRRIHSEPPFRTTTNCGGPLALGAACTVTVTYSPLFQTATGSGAVAPQADTGVITIEADAENAPLFVDVSGRATPVQTSAAGSNPPVASISTSQGSLTFNNAKVGTASAPQTILIANTGSTSIHITGLLTSPDFIASGDCQVLAIRASCAVSVSFTPKSPGTRVSALQIQSDASASLEFISLLGSSTPASVSLSPAALDFGSILVGTSATAGAAFVNTGAVPVTLGSISVTGDFASASASNTGTLCRSGATVAAGASCTIIVIFTPTQIGGRTGLLTVESSATLLPLAITLSGLGVKPQLAASPNALSFGDVQIGRSSQLSLTLNNGSNAPANGLSFATNGDYKTTATCGPVTLNAASSCSLTVTFTPTQAGNRAGTLVIASSDPASPLTVPLTGTGVGGGGFTLQVDGAQTGSATVPFGIPATYALSVAPLNGFSGTVALTCAPNAAVPYTACSVLPGTVTLANGAQASTVTITTVTAVKPALRLSSTGRRGTGILLGVITPTLLLLSRRRWKTLSGLALISSMLLLISGCGSGVGDTRIRYAAPGKYQFAVLASSTTGVPSTQSVTLNLTITGLGGQ